MVGAPFIAPYLANLDPSLIRKHLHTKDSFTLNQQRTRNLLQQVQTLKQARSIFFSVNEF